MSYAAEPRCLVVALQDLGSISMDASEASSSVHILTTMPIFDATKLLRTN